MMAGQFVITTQLDKRAPLQIIAPLNRNQVSANFG
jgi:CHASE1-domain containing sensor protein